MFWVPSYLALRLNDEAGSYISSHHAIHERNFYDCPTSLLQELCNSARIDGSGNLLRIDR